MLFSVVIPTRNRRALLQQTLESVRSQTFTDFETIVVDDGSVDGTRGDLCQAGGIRVIEQEAQGPGVARNAGARAAGGEYLAFLDSDDLWFPWTLATFARLIAQFEPTILTGRFIEIADSATPSGVCDQPVSSRRFDDYLRTAAYPISAGSGTAVVRRRAFIDAGGFTDLPINGEDHDLMLRLGEAPGFVQVLQPVTLAWRRHAAGVTANLQRSIDGMTYLVDGERHGRYPGGRRRASERRRIITRHVRPVSFACLRAGRLPAAMAFYRSTLGWHARQARVAYLVGWPVAAAASWLSGPREAGRS